MSKGHKDMTIPDKNPYGTRRSSKRETLEDLRSLLEDRGAKNVKNPSKNKETNEDEKQFIRNALEIDKIDKVNSRLKDLADKGDLANCFSGCKGNNDNTSSLKCKDKPVTFRCYSSCKTMILVLIASVSLMGPSRLFAEARNSESVKQVVQNGITVLVTMIFRHLKPALGQHVRRMV